MKKKFTLVEFILIVVVLALGVGGYAWYSHSKAQQLAEEKAARVTAAQGKIAVFEEDIVKLEKERLEIEAQQKKIDAELADAALKCDDAEKKTKAAKNAWDAALTAMNDARRASFNAPRVTTTGTSESGRISRKATEAQKALDDLLKQLEMVECHYHCMGRSKPTDKVKPSDAGRWSSSTFSRTPPHWTCKTHKYIFDTPLPYLDYKSQCSKLNAQILAAKKNVADLNEQCTAARQQESVTATEVVQSFDSTTWNKQVKLLQDKYTEERDAENDVQSAKRDLENKQREINSKLRAVTAKIESNASSIKSEKLVIAENSK